MSPEYLHRAIERGFLLPGDNVNCCTSCKHFTDARYDRVYITPMCMVHGGDNAMFMRQYVCGLSGTLYEVKHEANHVTPAPSTS